MTLPDYLSHLGNPALATTIIALADAAREIATAIRTTDTGKAGTRNTFGEEQATLDVRADEIMFSHLKAAGTVPVASSEECAEAVVLRELAASAPNPSAFGHPPSQGGFSVAFDPLDGSSLIDVNLAVGTIWAVWKTSELIGRTGRDIVAAGYAVYGPRTTFIIAAAGRVDEFQLDEAGDWQLKTSHLTIGEGKMFAPGNLRATADNAGYRKLVDFWMDAGYQLRYSGGMVPDVNQILLKGKGVFTYPGSKSSPAKLRLLYECAPLAYVVETAGGASSDGSRSILDLPMTAFDQRTPVALGSSDEVRRFEMMCDT